MMHAKFQDRRTSCSGEENFKGFYHIWAWRPSCSCDLNHLYKFCFPFPRRLNLKFCFGWPRGFSEEDGHINIYSPRVGADNSVGQI